MYGHVCIVLSALTLPSHYQLRSRSPAEAANPSTGVLLNGETSTRAAQLVLSDGAMPCSDLSFDSDRQSTLEVLGETVSISRTDTVRTDVQPVSPLRTVFTL